MANGEFTGLTWAWKSLISFLWLSGALPPPACARVLSAHARPSAPELSLEKSIAPLGHRQMLLQRTVQACAVLQLRPKVLREKTRAGDTDPGQFSGTCAYACVL